MRPFDAEEKAHPRIAESLSFRLDSRLLMIAGAKDCIVWKGNVMLYQEGAIIVLEKLLDG